MATMEKLYIVDNEYLDNYTKIMDLTTQAEKKLTTFCNILINLREEGAFEGVTADAVVEFAETLLSTISDNLSTAGRVQKEDMYAYVCEIDAADEALY